MLNTLANHNSDIQKLIERGYALSIDSNYLVVRDVPYLDSDKKLKIGAIVSKLVFINNDHVRMHDHQILFGGGHPHEMNGTPIRNLGGGAHTLALKSPDLKVERSFSNKPANGFSDLFEKIESYIRIISGPAMSLHDVNPFTYRVVAENDNSVFKLRDTLTSRAELGELNCKFENEVVALIGIGGTGSYLLDFLIKTPVKEIRGFDADKFHIHNSYRSPGRVEAEEFDKPKAEVFQRRYEGFRHGLALQSKYILSDSTEEMKGVTFAFICVDKGEARKEIIDLLIKLKIPFIDVGMGLEKANGSIGGTLRTTYFNPTNPGRNLEKQRVPLSDFPDHEYRTNIQISELNALNACLAVIKYKQLRGFYSDDPKYAHILFTIDGQQLLGEE